MKLTIHSSEIELFGESKCAKKKMQIKTLTGNGIARAAVDDDFSEFVNAI